MGGEQRVLEDGHVFEGLGYLIRATDAHATALRRRDARQVMAVESQVTGVGFDVTRDDGEHRGLAGAVGTDDPNGRPFFQLEGDLIGYDDLSEALGYTFQL